MKKQWLLFLALLPFVCCKPSPKVLWSFETGGMIYGAPAISGSNVLIGSNDHYFYAFDLKTGKVVWKTNLGERILVKPLVEKDAIYVGTANGNFFRLAPESGQIQWRYKSGNAIDFDACSDSDGVYFGSDDFLFYKLNRQGQKLWEFQTGHQVWGTCVFYKDLVIIASWDTQFYGLNRHTGSVVWKVSSGLINYGGPFLHRDSVYFGTHNKLYRIQAETGKILNFQTVGYVDHPVVFQNLLWMTDEGMAKRDLEGKLIGILPFKSGHTMQPVPYKNYLIVGTRLNELVAVSTDLKLVWKFQGKEEFWSEGVIQDGVYYTGNRSGHVYALRLPE